MSKLTHINDNGEAEMVDVSSKSESAREAKAIAMVNMKPETLDLIISGLNKKGDVLGVAKIAGIQAAKISVDLTPNIKKSCIEIIAIAKLNGKTGVEMEALTAASIAALTVYDMCKAVDRFMSIDSVKLLEKKGGKSGHWINPS